nr:AAA family ATPase [uncultured Holophaga sp.]
MQHTFTYGRQRLPICSGGVVQGEVSFLESSLDPDTVEGLMVAVSQGLPVLLEGPTGSGKTSVIRWLAGRTGHTYRRIQLNGATTVENFVGRYLLSAEGTFWVDGILTDAMRHGHWLLLDEINAALPEILFVINSILDDDRALILDQKEDRELVVPHPDFRLFAAMNPWQDYAGTKELNRSQLDRFVKFQYEYLPEAEEVQVLACQTGIDPELGRAGQGADPVLLRMVKVARAIRRMEEAGEVSAVCSTRQLIQWASLSRALEIKKAARIALVNKYEKADRGLVENELDKFFQDGEDLGAYLADATLANEAAS